ncbi:MAG: hypothetical protein ACI87E_000385 [Mariniblastus sp.]
MESEAASPESTAENGTTDSDELQRGCLSRLTPVTPPGCASCLTTVFLALTVILAAFVFWMDPDRVPWLHTVKPWRIVLILCLIIGIPFLVHRLVRLWLEGEQSPFPDLDYAWNAGLHALAANGLSIRSIPIYLILGSSTERQERSLFAASGIGMRVEGVPEGPAPIHWYANPDGIYICCSDASWMSALASLREELMMEAAGKGLLGRDNAPNRKTASQLAPAAQPAAPPAAANPADISDTLKGTMLLDQFLVPEAPPEPPAAEAVGQTDPSPYDETDSEDESQFAQPIEPVVVSQQYASASLQELQYLCKLLRRIREPVCSINGVVMLLQLEAIHGTAEEMDELYKATRGDLETVHFAAQVRSPVTTLIVGLERDRGFRELLRRVGRKRAVAQRFGKKFDVQTVPEPAQMANLSAHVCGAFEDWCYTLFRAEKSLSHPGNPKLYELLAKVRLGWKGRLSEILRQTIAASSSEPLLYSGCYVAASGDSQDRQGFVKGFLEKLKDEQEYVEWTKEALRENRIRRIFITIGTLVCVALAAWFALMLIIGFYQ